MYLLPLPTTLAPELRTSHLELRTSFPFGNLGSMDIFPFVTSFVIKMHVFRVKTAALHLRHFEKFQSIDKAATSTSTRPPACSYCIILPLIGFGRRRVNPLSLSVVEGWGWRRPSNWSRRSGGINFLS